VLALFLFLSGFLFFSLCWCDFFLFLSKLNIVLLKIILLEWGSIDLDDSIFDESLSSDELVVCGIVDDIYNFGLVSELFRSPCEVSLVDSKSSVLVVSTSSSHSADLLFTNLSVSRLSSHFKLSLFLVNWHTTSSCSSLVAWISWDTHDLLINNKLRNESY
jgi:hypothetical protein